MALKANKKPNSEEPEQRQSRTFSPFDNPTNISGKLRKIGIGKAKKAKIRKRVLELRGKEEPFFRAGKTSARIRIDP